MTLTLPLLADAALANGCATTTTGTRYASSDARWLLVILAMNIDKLTLLFGGSAQGAEPNQWETEGGNVALSRRSPERPDQVVDMTGLQQNHASWKDREIERGSRPLADLCLEAEPLDLVLGSQRA